MKITEAITISYGSTRHPLSSIIERVANSRYALGYEFRGLSYFPDEKKVTLVFQLPLTVQPANESKPCDPNYVSTPDASHVSTPETGE